MFLVGKKENKAGDLEKDNHTTAKLCYSGDSRMVAAKGTNTESHDFRLLME